MSFGHMIFGRKAAPGDLYLAALWLGSTAFVFLGLSLIALNMDIELLLVVCGLFIAPAIYFLRPDLKTPINSVVFKKLELLMLAIIALTAWVFISILWFRSIWAILITILLLGVVALVLWLPGYAGRGTNPEIDERLRKLEAFSSADSFNVAFAFTALLFILGFFRIITMDVRQAFTIMVWLFILTKSVSMAYYYRRGDIDER